MKHTFTTIVTSAFVIALMVVPVFAETTATAGQAQAKRMMPQRVPTLNGTCVANAVGVREDLLVVARNTHNKSVVDALGVRKTELMSAWNLTDAKARRAAREAGWSKYKTSTETARKALRADTSAAYTQFNASVKACGVQYTEQPTSAEVQ